MRITFHLKKQWNHEILIFIAIALLFSCASAGRAKYAEPFTSIEAPEGKAVVYVYHNKDFATSAGGQDAACYPASYDPQGKFNLLIGRKMPGVVWTRPGEAARFVLDPTDNKIVIATLFAKTYGGTQMKDTLLLNDLGAGDIVYIDVSLNGLLKKINIEIVSEADIIPLLQKGKLMNPYFPRVGQ